MNEPNASEVKRVVLSVEDDTAAYFLILSAFRDLGSGLELQRVENGEEALEFLKRRVKFINALKPRLVWLNMNLPRIGGPEVLAAMREDESLRDIPVVVFSSSPLDADRA